jgi:hypothetical protein
MLKLAIAVVAVLSTVVTAVNQVIQSVTPLRFWWMRRGLNVAVRNLELGDRNRSWAWFWEWLGLWPHRWTREALWDARINPTSDWWPDWVDGGAFLGWLEAKIEGRPNPVGWAQDRERFLAWWARLESAQTRGFKRMLLGLSAAIGIAMCIWLGLDPQSLAQSLREDPQLVSLLGSRQGEPVTPPDFEEFATVFSSRLAEQSTGMSDDAAAGLGGLAAVYFRDADGGTLAEKAAGVASAFEALREATPMGASPDEVRALISAALEQVLVRQRNDALELLDSDGEWTEPTTTEALFFAELGRLSDQEQHLSPQAAGAYILWAQHEGQAAAVLRSLESAEAHAAEGLTVTDIDAGVAAAQATWRGYSSTDPDLIALLRAGPRYSWGALLMGCLIGFGAPFWFELLEAIIAGVRGRRYRAIKTDATDQGTGDDEE